MTNLYEFLNRIYNDPRSRLSEADVQWLKQFLQKPDNELHFKSRKVGGDEDDPVFEQDYALAGEPDELFRMITEAMFENGMFANLVIVAGNLFRDHVPNCPECSQAIYDAQMGYINYEFSPHKPI